MTKRFAHTREGSSVADWEPIEVHLEAVAERAAEFASWLCHSSGGSSSWGRLLGRWHDLGKYSDEFQEMLYATSGPDAHIEQLPGRVDHSTAGAQHAMEVAGPGARLLAYAVAGHHAGLANNAQLQNRLDKTVPDWRSHADPALLTGGDTLGFPPLTTRTDERDRFAFQCAFLTRMLFSCLVDADRLETELFCSPERAEERKPPPEARQLQTVLDRHLETLVASAPPSQVNQKRQEVLQACQQAAELSPGFFSLSVPTGGGKTLASLAFALRHAGRHGLRRVVMAIPFTSIIEQTAETYRTVFEAALGEGVVLEHHSGLDPTVETRANRLAAENWDAPLVVTTNVQLFESLFASRTTPCRKLHRLAGSVIILDEAQTLPVRLLRPCLEALRELVQNYGCSIVLCTATQPALERRNNFSIGLADVREIIPDPKALAAQMQRVQSTRLGVQSDDQLVGRLAEHPRWLTIVNTKAHAAGVYQRLAGDGKPPPDLFHLSTLMCAAHRSEKLAEIRALLKSDLPCRVVSTQLVEAGVDVDFPVVFRAMAGIDSLAQAAGRCNREGRLPQLGRFFLFDPLEVQPRGYLGATAQTSRELLHNATDPLDPETVRRYFEMHYWDQEGVNRWDDPRVMECFPEERGQFAYDFQDAADRFQLIEETSRPVFVPFKKGRQLIHELRRLGPSRGLLRRLQRYTVALSPWAFSSLAVSGDLSEVSPGYFALDNDSLYHTHRGVKMDQPGFLAAESLVV